MTRYTNNIDDVITKAETAREAADIIARRIYGRRGFCGTLRLDSAASDGKSAVYQAFIGVALRGSPRVSAGRNIWLYASR